MSSESSITRQRSRGDEAGRSSDAEQIYATAIRGHHLLAKEEELDLARRLEIAEIDLWERLITGPLEAEARAHLRALVPPVEAESAAQARAADLDRLIATRVIAALDKRARTEIRALETAADQIRERFTYCNLRLVPSTIRRYGYHNAVSSLSMGDLIQEGNLGLLKAIPRFDYRRGLRFSTFATWWIRHYLVRARQNQSAEIRVPVHIQDLATKVHRAQKQLHDKLGRDPSQIEIARSLKVSPKSLEALKGERLLYREAIPSFDSIGEDGEEPSHPTSATPLPDEVLERLRANGQIAAAIAELPPLLAQIIRRRYGFDGGTHETLLEIGKSMRLSRERIRQLEKKALGILQPALGIRT